jgi:hypothetical protein
MARREAHDPEAGGPTPQLGRSERVVGEQEVVHRVLRPLATPIHMFADQRVDPRLVCRGAGAPERLV